MTNQEEKELMPLALAGNVPARNAIVMSFLYLLQRQAGRICNDRKKELVNVAVLDILKNFNRYDTKYGARASTYFVTRAKHIMKTYLKLDKVITSPHNHTPIETQQFNRALNLRDLDEDFRSTNRYREAGLDHGLMPDEAAERVELINAVQTALLRYPVRVRTILLLRYSGHTLNQCSKILGISRERVRQLQVKAEVVIKGLLEKCNEQDCG